MPELQDVLIGAFVISMMLSVGAELTWGRLRAITARPALLGGGLAAGYLVVPVAAWLIGHGLGMAPAAHAGLLLCAAAPGGPIGAMFTQRATGDLALSVALLMLVNLINLFATPITLQLLGATPGDNIAGELLGMAATILGFQIVPLIVGVQLRESRPQLADKVGRYGKLVANGLLVLAVIGITATQYELLLGTKWTTLLAIEGLTLVSMAAGGLLIPGGPRTRAAGALSNTVRSQSLSILLASTRFPSPETLLVVLCYSVLMFFNGIGAAEIFRRTLPTERIKAPTEGGEK